MVGTVDALAMRYGCRPSDIIFDTFDKFIIDIQVATRQSSKESEYESRVKNLLMEKEEAERKRAEIKKS